MGTGLALKQTVQNRCANHEAPTRLRTGPRGKTEQLKGDNLHPKNWIKGRMHNSPGELPPTRCAEVESLVGLGNGADTCLTCSLQKLNRKYWRTKPWQREEERNSPALGLKPTSYHQALGEKLSCSQVAPSAGCVVPPHQIGGTNHCCGEDVGLLDSLSEPGYQFLCHPLYNTSSPPIACTR